MTQSQLRQTDRAARLEIPNDSWLFWAPTASTNGADTHSYFRCCSPKRFPSEGRPRSPPRRTPSSGPCSNSTDSTTPPPRCSASTTVEQLQTYFFPSSFSRNIFRSIGFSLFFRKKGGLIFLFVELPQLQLQLAGSSWKCSYCPGRGWQRYNQTGEF